MCMAKQLIENSHCRQCVPYASIELRIWYFYAAMERVNFAVIKLKGVPFAVKLLKSAFYYFNMTRTMTYYNIFR